MIKDWVHGVGRSPVCQILLQIVVRAVITSSPPAWTSSAGMLSTPADFQFFSDCTAVEAAVQSLKKGKSAGVTCTADFESGLFVLTGNWSKGAECLIDGFKGYELE